jgi:hypothetical protein
MQINLELMSVLAECQQNIHLPEHMKEECHMYTLFSYPATYCFFVLSMANYLITYAAIMTLWHVALPGFIIISIELLMLLCIVVPAAACLRMLGSFGAIMTAQWSQ